MDQTFCLERSHDEGAHWNSVFWSNEKEAVLKEFGRQTQLPGHLPTRVVDDHGLVIATTQK